MSFAVSRRRRARKTTPPPHIPPAVYFHAKETGDLAITPWTRLVNDHDLLQLAETAEKEAGSSFRIHSLLLSRTEYTSPKAIIAICTAIAPTLVELDLSKSSGIVDPVVQHIGVHCMHLQKVVLDDCKDLSLVGFTGLFERCIQLQFISLARCIGVSDMVVQTIAANCHKLVHLDVNGCENCADLSCKALASGCSELQYLNLSNGPRVTNKGMIDIARGNKKLTALHVAFPSKSSRLGDDAVSLLGTLSTKLREINLSGWELVTDVGIQWVCSGCPELTKLSLSKCRYVSDRSLLAVATSLHALESIDISHCKLISDVGLKHLSTGCSKLREVCLDGLYLLSDGRSRAAAVSKRLTDSTISPMLRNLKGSYKAQGDELLSDAGEIGLPALASKSTGVEVLRMHGCLNVGNSCMRSIGMHMQQLREMYLVNNETCTAKGIVDLVELCGKSLTCLDLSGVKCVNEICQKAIGTRCPQLNTLNLSRCHELSDDGFRYLMVGCRALEKLYLDDNPQLSDISCYHISVNVGAIKAPQVWDEDMEAVLAARKGGAFMCQLKTLHLARNRLVTDTGIGWVLEQHPSIQDLNVVGTGVTTGPLLCALKGQRQFCEVRNVEGHFGIAKMYRSEDRWREHFYEDQWQKAIIIQLAWRRMHARKVVRHLRQQAMLGWVCVQLQSAFRGRQTRRRLRAEADLLARKNHIARKFQRLWRIHVLRKREMRLKVIKQRLRMLCSIRTFQRRWRLYLLIREETARTSGQQLAASKSKRFAALGFQKLWRGYCVRKRLPSIRLQHAILLARRNDAARRIQQAYRGYILTKKARSAFLALRYAAGLAGRMWRRIVARRFRRALAETMRKAATEIQRIYRGVRGRRMAAARREEDMRMRKDKAVRAVQKLCRVLMARRGLLRSKQTRARYKRAAINIQRIWRGYVGRKRVANLKEYEAYIREQRIILEHWAAIKIQSAWRRVMAVNFVNKLRADRPHVILAGWAEDGENAVGLNSNDTWQVPSLVDIAPFHPPALHLATTPTAGEPLNAEGAGEAGGAGVWKLYKDPATGAAYFHDATTGQSMWAASS